MDKLHIQDFFFEKFTPKIQLNVVILISLTSALKSICLNIPIVSDKSDKTLPCVHSITPTIGLRETFKRVAENVHFRSRTATFAMR